ncbi:Chromosome partition protein Smc [Streptococcus sanguinis]|uniref:Membrane protein, putative n=1 Tax=Streptococcus sanguinis (strain SK36) TaxID=388919 RepID=A3CR95_STRSV|nr:YhgE/Pip domain-containing protein [Streptococcus sanguinis]ABN45700.1 Membrane protein, putative [Streptococcus sanguinis SK36]MBZ2055890.1 YhgE/Pip domain-containing protein [Streptococcus sanguinis]RSI16349.1 Chromosome partition protein Smc [Streptococcus sanguinis]
MLREWKAILKKPAFIIVMLGVSMIPALYNVIFLSSMWDPYGKVSDLPVAVVNQDKAVTASGKTLSIGEDVVSSLKENKNLDFHFVSKEDAQNGLEKGDYYMVVTLPSDLSERAASILTDNPQQMKIDYQTSSGHSFIAGKMSDSAMTSLKQTVAQNVTDTYTSALFKNMGDLKTGLVKASDGAQQLASGSQQLGSGGQTIADNLRTLNQATTKLSSGAAQFNTGLQTYTGSVAQVSSGLGSLSNGINTYANGVSTVATGANQLSGRSADLLGGVQQLTQSGDGVQALSTGVTNLNTGLATLKSSVDTTLANNQQNVNDLATGLTQLNASIQAAASDSAVSTDSIEASLTSIAASAQAIINNNQDAKAAALASVQGTSAYQGLSSEAKAEIDAAVSASQAGSDQSAQTILSEIDTMRASLETIKGASQTKLSQLESASNQVLPQASSMINGLYNGLSTVSTSLGSASGGANQLVAGVDTLNEKLTTGATQLEQGVTSYTNAVGQLSEGTSALASKNPDLLANTTKLANGAAQLTDKSPELTSSFGKLADGTNQLASGTEKLADGSSALTDNLSKLTVGTSDLSNGLSDAGDKLSTVSTKEDNAKTLADPLTLSKTDENKVEKNGIGMAPYMISVALFVAAISTNIIFSTLPSGQEPKTRRDWLKARIEVNGVISVVAGVLVYGAVHLIGLSANHEWATLGLIVLASMTFMALVTALVTWDSKLGAFASLILLLLQLASSAGTYPLELTSKIFQVINPWLPMSYSVSGLRQTISMNGQIGSQVLFLAFVLVLFMALGTLVYRTDKKKLA